MYSIGRPMTSLISGPKGIRSRRTLVILLLKQCLW